MLKSSLTTDSQIPKTHSCCCDSEISRLKMEQGLAFEVSLNLCSGSSLLAYCTAGTIRAKPGSFKSYLPTSRHR